MLWEELEHFHRAWHVINIGKGEAMYRKRKQYGASLLEVMVALLVTSLGLLGMAGLQVASAKYRVNVQSNGVVAQLVSDIAERIRVNPEMAGPSFDPSAGGGNSKYILESTWATQIKEKLIVAVEKDCGINECTWDERADYDMERWRMRVRDELPQGNALLEGNRRDGIQVTLMWMDKEQTAWTEDKEAGERVMALKQAPICNEEAEGTIVHNCCPKVVQAPAGVRCLRMSFLP